MEWGKLSLILLIHKHSMAMREGTTLNILSWKSDIESIQQQRTKSKALSCSKIYTIPYLY